MNTARRLERAGKGRLQEELRLNGEITLADGRATSTSLCLTSDGLYLVLLRVEGEDDVIDLLGANRHLRYRSQLLGDRLEVDRWVLSVPWGRADRARRLIGLARIRREFGPGPACDADEFELRRARAAVDDPDGAWAWSGPFIDEVGALERAWLLRWLDADERLIAWKASDERHRFGASVLVSAEGPTRLVLTDRRQGLVALSPVGDRWSVTLARGAVELASSAVGRGALRVDGDELRLAFGDERIFVELVRLAKLEPLARRRGVARALWLRQRGGAELTRAAAILDELAAVDPLARLARVLLVDPLGAPARDRPLLALIAGEGEQAASAADSATALIVAAKAEAPTLPDPVFEALHELVDRSQASTPEELVDWWRAWELGPELGEVLVGHLCELGQRGLEVALPLHEQLRPILQAKLTDDPADAALLDFVLAEHLLALGRAEAALGLLSERRRALPSEQLQDLLPPSPARGGQRIRIELYELAASAHALLGDRHGVALAELARLQPLVLERVDALIHNLQGTAGVDEGPESLLTRARRVRELLDDDGFAPPAQLTAAPADATPATAEGPLVQAPPPPRVRPLDAEQIELLRHPAARADGVLGRLQEALAKVAVPDCSVLKSYCERANLARDRALARALTDATVILGLGGVEVFISRGDKAVGLRAYEGDSSFLLIGGDHVKTSSDAYLDEAALRFAVAAELAHLRYSHSRVTGDEVWAGTVDLGLTGLGMLIVAAPMLKGLKAPAKHLLDKVGAPAIKRWRQKLAGRDAYSLASDNSQVIAAHRAMQLSADRAGLVVCGDPRAAIRAMFTVHPAYLSMWPLVGSHGLRTTVTREIRADDERERGRLEDLAVRVAALLSFYLSDEYAALRAAIVSD